MNYSVIILGQNKLGYFTFLSEVRYSIESGPSAGQRWRLQVDKESLPILAASCSPILVEKR